MISQPQRETMFAIACREDGYELVKPRQRGTATSLQYDQETGLIAEFHSHCNMAAFYSGTDNRDERAFRIYGVLGRLNSITPELTVRIGIYGHYGIPDLKAAFSGQPHGIGIKAPANTQGFFGPEAVGEDKRRPAGFATLRRR